MELNNNTTPNLLVIAKQLTQAPGHCFQSFVKSFSRWQTFRCSVIFSIFLPDETNYVFFTQIFFPQKFLNATVTIFLGFAGR